MSEDTLKELIRTGKLTQEAADEARVKVDKTLQACAFALHSLMCNKEHEQSVEMMLQPTTKKCKWYIEDTLEFGWDAPDHNFWLLKTVEIMREQEIDGSEEMRVFVKRLSNVVAEVRGLIDWYPNSLRLLEEIIKA
ncbi:unnamed protein product [marine sediment metagenome]|uniref:Uncharacterized protein n=1 Tax=marine sediment metagenome TaxID=412755 RepID=X0URU2_9ZZZZ